MAYSLNKTISTFIKTIKNHKVLILVNVVVILIIIVGIIIFYHKSTAVRPPGITITHSTQNPDEKDPKVRHYKWKGSDTEPKYISLPSIGESGFIQKVGVDQNKQVTVPNNIHMAGWFADSVKPGEKGLSIIDGHVNGRNTNDAIFAKLDKLKKEDKFIVELGGGTKLNYVVVSVDNVDTQNAASVLFSQDPKISSQLNLITCAGHYDSSIKTYNKRVVITAKLF